jgi:hypothetical protein
LSGNSKFIDEKIAKLEMELKQTNEVFEEGAQK